MNEIVKSENIEASPLRSAILGASLGVFAARALTGAAIVTGGKMVAKKVYNGLFPSKVYGTAISSPTDGVVQSLNQIKSATRLILSEVNDAVIDATFADVQNDLEISMKLIGEAIASPSTAIDRLSIAINKCDHALATLNDRDDIQWIGAYYNAASQYIYATKLLIDRFDSTDDIYKETISVLITNIDTFDAYVNNDDKIEDLLDQIKNKYTEVAKSGSYYKFGYKTSDFGTVGLLQAKEDRMEGVRLEFMTSELDLAKSCLIQPDVTTNWQFVKDSLVAELESLSQ